MLTEAEVLEEVKKALGITGEYLDGTLTVYMHEVMQYLGDAGIHDDVLFSSASVGIIARGVCDLWNYGSAGGVLSQYFMQRAAQLSYGAVQDK